MSDTYESPLATRYASSEMLKLFSPFSRYTTWRQLWVALAEVQQQLDLPITTEQINELKAHVSAIDFALVEQYEAELHHDVMAHIHAYGDQCPKARPIIHLGATSCYVTDNTDLILMKKALKLLHTKLCEVIKYLAEFAKEYRNTPCLAYTHLQPAQLTTVGKRTCLWIQDLLTDWQAMGEILAHLRFLGAKGATGTQGSFLALFEGDHEKVKQLDLLIANKMGFDTILLISAQTYPRKIDCTVISTLTSFAISAHKFATDLRLLMHLKEIQEPFAPNQVGSSAMPYKRNPILSERICSLARYLMALNAIPIHTAANQWFERTLDDSACRRLSIPEAFLAADGIITLLQVLSRQLQVHPKIIESHVQAELPFLAAENLLMLSVKRGGDRQALHEKMRVYCQKALEGVKQGRENDLLRRLIEDPAFALNDKDLHKLADVTHFVGRAPSQVEEFLEEEIYPKLGR